jgi:hypothetical protein
LQSALMRWPGQRVDVERPQWAEPEHPTAAIEHAGAAAEVECGRGSSFRQQRQRCPR